MAATAPVRSLPCQQWKSRGPFRSRMICMAVTRSSSLSNVARVMQDQRGALCFFGVGVVATEIQYFPHTEFFQFPEASCGRLVRTIYPVSDPVEVFQPAFITQGDFLCLQVR